MRGTINEEERRKEIEREERIGAARVNGNERQKCLQEREGMRKRSKRENKERWGEGRKGRE